MMCMAANNDMGNLRNNPGIDMKKLVYAALRTALPFLLAGLSACTTLGPDFETPAADIEAQWLEQDSQTMESRTAVNSEWWKPLGPRARIGILSTQTPKDPALSSSVACQGRLTFRRMKWSGPWKDL